MTIEDNYCTGCGRWWPFHGRCENCSPGPIRTRPEAQVDRVLGGVMLAGLIFLGLWFGVWFLVDVTEAVASWLT